MKAPPILETVAIILVLLWLLGVVFGFVLAGYLHLLLVLGIVLIGVRLFRGGDPLR